MERARNFIRAGSSFSLALMLNACSGFPQNSEVQSIPTPEVVPTSTSVPISASNDAPTPTPTENPLFKQRDLRITNEVAIMRAATVGFLINGQRFGHGSIIQQEDKYYILTAEHVAVGLRNQVNTQVRIPGLGIYPLDPNKFFIWNKVQQEDESGSLLPVQDEIDRLLRSAVAERIIHPLRLSARIIKSDEAVAIPREELGVYTIYRNGIFLRAQNRYFLTSPNSDSTQICKGDSGSPALAIPITGEVFGILVAGNNFKPETVLSEKICSDTAFVRPIS